MKRIPFAPILAASLIILPSLAFAADPGATFVPLTSIPGITDLTSAPSFPALLNGLYRILIGVAAFLAIARFIYAGYTIMTDSGSVTKNKKAKEIIQNTVIGLVLVLSPVIVFGIINPKVLDLSLDFSSLQSSNGTGDNVQICSPACTGGQVCDGGKCVTAASVNDTSNCGVIKNGSSLPTTKEQNCCQAQSGCKVQVSGSSALNKPTCACSSTPAGTVVASYKGGASAPPSLIPSTGKVNTGCKQVQDGEILDPQNNASQQCCNYQESSSVRCEVKTTTNSDLSQVNYCSCTKK